MTPGDETGVTDEALTAPAWPNDAPSPGTPGSMMKTLFSHIQVLVHQVPAGSRQCQCLTLWPKSLVQNICNEHVNKRETLECKLYGLIDI